MHLWCQFYEFECIFSFLSREIPYTYSCIHVYTPRETEGKKEFPRRRGDIGRGKFFCHFCYDYHQNCHHSYHCSRHNHHRRKRVPTTKRRQSQRGVLHEVVIGVSTLWRRFDHSILLHVWNSLSFRCRYIKITQANKQIDYFHAFPAAFSTL